MLFFPEGSWTNGHCLISFKTAAFRLGFPVLPFALQYPYENLNIAGVGRAASCFFMLRTMLQLYNRMRVWQLRPYTPSADEIDQPLLFARNVRQVRLAIHSCLVSDVDLICAGDCYKARS